MNISESIISEIKVTLELLHTQGEFTLIKRKLHIALIHQSTSSSIEITSEKNALRDVADFVESMRGETWKRKTK